MSKPVYILGISCYYHDSGIALLKDGEVIFAAQEERYTRKKHDEAVPVKAVEQALKFAGITIKDIDAVGFYEKPLLKFFDRILRTYFKVWPRGLITYHRAMQEWMTKKLWIPTNLQKELKYKVMGLAPYGEPKYMKEMRELIDVKEDGSFALNMKYFTYEYGLRMTGREIEKLFGQPTRKGEGAMTQFHKDIARSLQEITEEIMIKIAKHAKKLHPSENLCLAGGVALNCVANGKILRSSLFKNIFIQPASGDAGGSLGVALAIWHRIYNGARIPKMEHVFLGNAYTNEEIESYLQSQNVPYERFDDAALIERVSGLLAGENAEPRTAESNGEAGARVIGWFQGRMEFGPRSLGNRSIIADARNKENWQKVNLKIKFRESFRPFAPTILEERVSDYFDLDQPSPYMLLVADTRPEKRNEIPAVTHVDGSARIQTINRSQNPRYYDLLNAFERRTGCPVIINTSFNIRGEPIVES